MPCQRFAAVHSQYSPTLVDALGWGHMMHLVIKRLIDDSTVIKNDIRIFNICAVQITQRVLHPDFIVAVWKILVCVCSTRLLAGLSRHHLLARLIDQILKFKSLNQICVPDESAIFDANISVLLHDLGNFFRALLQIIGIPIHRCKLLHCNLELPSQICCWYRSLGIANLIKPCNRLLTRTCWERDWRTVGLHELSCSVCRLSTEDDKVQ
mmetsp:Transcript_24546/g.38946  ORF Transcript_24546/g.38946 Transcript_24546/m.38946 type:complete len:210 (+) Transcript_24546:294-923(+)